MRTRALPTSATRKASASSSSASACLGLIGAILEQRLVTVYREPTPNGYVSKADVGPDGTLATRAFPDASVPVSRFM